MNQLVARNEFATELATQDTASAAVAAQAKALVEARYIMAVRRPRDMDDVRQRMLKECTRPSFAAVARYTKPIGKDRSKWPTGPSIRFAEAAVRCMTNITVETITVYDDRQKRIVRVMVTDLEANVPYSQDITIAKTIERRQKKEGDTVISTRTNSYGDTVYILEATDDDITNKQQALISKAVRTLGLRLIPGDIVDECMDQVMVTQQNVDAQDPDAAKRKLFDSFAAIGVQAHQLKDYLGHEGVTLTQKEIAELRSLYAAIRDGEATWREVMDARAPAAESSSQGGSSATPTGSKLDAVRQAAAAKKQQPASAKADPETGEVPAPPPPSPQPKAATYAQIVERIQATKDRDSADLLLDQARHLPADQQAELAAVIERQFVSK